MKIVSNKLVAEAGDPRVIQTTTPNKGGAITPKYLIMHYTAGRSAESSVDWFKNPEANASAHLVIAKDGTITQLIDFNKKAFHAGVSRWNGETQLNKNTIGIELDNPGKLTHSGGVWRSWFGVSYPESKVVVGTHRHQTIPAGWHIYTAAQIDSALRASRAIVKHYQLLNILGHEDIAPVRKEDPGFAFPLESFRSNVMGRQDDVAELFKVNTPSVNLRSEPSTQATIIAQLAINTKVEFINSNAAWYHVYVMTGDSVEREGWIHSSLLTKL